MIEHRPSTAYVLLLLTALAAWCLHDVQRLLPAGVLLGAILLSYRFEKQVLRPTLGTLAIGGSLAWAFCHFVLLGGQPQIHVSIYSFQLVQSICLALLMLIGVQWISWRSSQFDWLLLSIGALMMFSGVSWQTMQRKSLFVLLALAFITILLIFRLFPRFRAHHARPEPGQAGALRIYYSRMVLLVALFLGLSLSTIRSMEFLDRHFSEMLTRFLMGGDRDWSGFSGHTHLQGGKEIQLSEQIAFTVRSPQAIDYWRGNILTIYRDGHWFPQETLHLPVPAGRGLDDWQLYRVDAPPKQAGQRVEVEMENHYHGLMFAPAATREVEVPAQTSLYQNQYQLFRRELRQNRHAYRLYLSQDEELPARWDRSILGENLDIDPDQRLRLAPLALRVSNGARTHLDRARLIEKWFHQEFTYSLKVDPIPQGQDPTEAFINGRRPAYCSWFASGMVLMLRSIGVPAHLVSGWRSMEWNALARVWVVKEKAAHDWVEVLDAQNNRWVRFDPTPPAQLAQLTGQNGSGWLRQLSDGLGLLLQQTRQQLAGMSMQQRLDWLRNLALNLLAQPLFYLALLLLLGLNQLLKRRKKSIAPPAATEALAYAGADPAVAQALVRLEHWLQARQLALPRYQTLEAWLPQARIRLSQEESAQLSRIVGLFEQVRFGKNSETFRQELLTEIDRLKEPETAAETGRPV